MDALANLLDGPRGRDAFLLRTIMEPPWSVRMADEAPVGLIAVVRGSAWLVPEADPDGSGRAADLAAPTQLGAGTVAVVKGPAPVTLAGDAETPPQVVCGPGGRRTTPDGADVSSTMSLGIRTWGNDPDGSTRLLMGCYQFRGEISRRVLDALPESLVLDTDPWGAPLVALLDAEIGTDEPGQRAVLDRLFDLLLVSAVRAWFRQPGADVPAWYTAHQDPVVGRALRMLQERPERPWTVANLAAEAGVSRSVLARRFTERRGVPPMTYLKEWRLSRTADLLLDPDLTLDSIARRVGYSDGSTLSTVFKSARGASPREYRESAR